MRDLTSKRWIVAKGVLFLVIAAAAAALLILESPNLTTAVLLALLVWSSCRFYYFLFYVLEKYVDPKLRYAGVFALAWSIPQSRRRLWRKGLLLLAVLAGAFLAIVVTQPLWAFGLLAWATPGIVWRVDTREPLVALSFDDGPAPDHTPKVLEILARHRAHATFFLIGDRAARYPKSVDELRAAGHEVGNHSFTLRSTLHASDQEFRAVLERTENVLRLSGPTKLFRPPGGKIRAAQVRIAHERGYRVVLGSAYPFDGAHPPAAYIEWLVTKNLAPGVIAILHDGIADPSRTIAALDGILTAGRRKGLRFVTVGELLAAPQAACYDPGRDDCGPSLGLPLAAVRSPHGGGARR